MKLYKKNIVKLAKSDELINQYIDDLINHE